MTDTEVKFIDLKYDANKSEQSASEVVYALFPEWRRDNDELQFKTFTEGITNTVRFFPFCS